MVYVRPIRPVRTLPPGNIRTWKNPHVLPSERSTVATQARAQSVLRKQLPKLRSTGNWVHHWQNCMHMLLQNPEPRLIVDSDLRRQQLQNQARTISEADYYGLCNQNNRQSSAGREREKWSLLGQASLRSTFNSSYENSVIHKYH